MRRAVLGSAMVAVLALAGCGDDDEGPIPQTGVPETTTTSEASATTAAPGDHDHHDGANVHHGGVHHDDGGRFGLTRRAHLTAGGGGRGAAVAPELARARAADPT